MTVHNQYHTGQFTNCTRKGAALNPSPSIDTRRWLTLLALLALAACGNGVEAPAPVRPAVVVQPQPGDSADFDTYAGALAARHETPLSFRIDGKLLSRPVDLGSRVTAGQVLAELDPADFALRASAARAGVASARADAQLADAELKRHQEIFARRVISQSLLDNKRAVADAAGARLSQAQSQLKVAENAARYTRLTAPAAGVITAINAEPGQVVAPGMPVLTLAQTDAIEAQINVPEARVASLLLNAPAKVLLWSDRGVALPGAIREIAPQADPRTRTFDVRVALQNPPPGAQLGMTVQVLLGDSSRTPSLRVPLGAVTELDGKASVWRVDPATRRVSPQVVTVAAWRDDEALIASGVAPDDYVVAAGVHLLTNGQEIRPIDRRNRPIELR